MTQPPQDHPWICDACGATTPVRVWTREKITVRCTVCGQVREFPPIRERESDEPWR